jgi:hypothetical protein
LKGKRGVVLAAAAEPATEGEAGRGGSEPGREMLDIGLVTAVDHAGGTFWGGTGTTVGFAPRGSVVAAETLGRGVKGLVIGLGGRGGRLMRRVSRLGAFGSAPGWGAAGFSGSAIT